jgi:hypothetical protein
MDDGSTDDVWGVVSKYVHLGVAEYWNRTGFPGHGTANGQKHWSNDCFAYLAKYRKETQVRSALFRCCRQARRIRHRQCWGG